MYLFKIACTSTIIEDLWQLSRENTTPRFAQQTLVGGKIDPPETVQPTLCLNPAAGSVRKYLDRRQCPSSCDTLLSRTSAVFSTPTTLA